MTDTDLHRVDAHARWLASDSLALRPESASQLAGGPVLLAGWMGDEGDDRGYEVVGGVAVVRVTGALMDRAMWWWDGYDAIQSRAEKAHADGSVRAVLVDFDSPGGMVAGLFDCMRALRAMRIKSGKRMVAWVGSGAYSAAYGLAAACDEVVTSDTAGTGSVGVIASLMSRVDQLAQDGIEVRVVSSGAEKTDGHPAVAISDGAEARLRARVGELAGMFFAEVGAGRSALTAAALGALDGGIRYGRAAIAAGLADRISTRAALLAELSAAPVTAPQRATTAAPAGRASRTTMDEKIAALIAAKTGETDTERQYGALQALLTKAEKHDELAAKVSKIEEDAETAAFEATLKAGLDSHKINDEEAQWWRGERAEGRATAKSLDANLSRRVAPKLAASAAEHVEAKQPIAGPTCSATGSSDPRLPGILAKPYATLSWDDRNTFATLAPEQHQRARNAWVAAGCPKA